MPFDSRSFAYVAGDNSCVIASPPPTLGLPAFYTRHCSVYGFPIVSSGRAPDTALQRVWSLVAGILANRHDLLIRLLENGVVFAIIGATEVTTDIPEYADLNTAFPGTDWNARARGLGATDARPATSSAEENILCYPGDAHAGESIAITQFAHTIHTMALNELDGSFEAALRDTYAAALGAGKWADTYAGTNHFEYRAEGVQSYFDVNPDRHAGDGIHNHVNTRAELEADDNALYRLIADTLATHWLPALRPDGSAGAAPRAATRALPGGARLGYPRPGRGRGPRGAA